MFQVHSCQKAFSKQICDLSPFSLSLPLPLFSPILPISLCFLLSHFYIHIILERFLVYILEIISAAIYLHLSKTVPTYAYCLGTILNKIFILKSVLIWVINTVTLQIILAFVETETRNRKARTIVNTPTGYHLPEKDF